MTPETLDRLRDPAGRLWCAVACEYRSELLARDSLRETGIDVWWPHYATVVTRRIGTVDRRLPVLRGLFAGYLLAGIEEPAATAVIKSTKGVATVVTGTDRAALFLRPQKLAEWRAKALNAEGLFEPPTWALARHGPSFAAGERVRIASGNPFVGFMAAVRAVTGSAVTAELEEQIFGRRITVAVDATQLEMAPAIDQHRGNG